MSGGVRSNIYYIVVSVCKLKSAQSRAIPPSKGDVSLTCSLLFPLSGCIWLCSLLPLVLEKKRSGVMMKIKLVTLMRLVLYSDVPHVFLLNQSDFAVNSYNLYFTEPY